ncbi:MAG: efflux transporter outer membrane subunit [Methylobacter sp.]
MIRRITLYRLLLFTLYLGFMLVLMSGCAWIPPGDKPAEFMPAPSMEHALSDTGSAAPHDAGHWPPARWWREFGSPELNDLMDAALKDNIGLKVAAARLRQAQALAQVEGARLLPFLDASAGLETGRFSENGFNVALRGENYFSAFITPMSLRYQFDFWGKNRAALNAALGEAAAESAEQDHALLQLTAAIARSYMHGMALRQQLDLAHDMAKLKSDLLDINKTRFRLGLDSADPVQQANIELEQINKREAGLRDQLALQRNLLARLIGKGPDATQKLFAGTGIGTDRMRLPAKLPLELLSRRPDLAAALHLAGAAAERVKVAKASFLPTIDLTAFIGVNAMRLTKGGSSLANLLFSGSSFSYGIAPGLRLPLFEGGRLRGELSAQRAEYDGAVELYNATLLQAVQEAADSLSRWRETNAALAAHGRLLSAEQESLNLAQTRFRSGLDDRRTTLNRRHAMLDQEYALKHLQSDQLIAMVDLIEALGGGYANTVKTAQPMPEQKRSGWLPW